VLFRSPISHFTQSTPVLAVEVEEGADRLTAALVGRGFKAKQDESYVLLALDDESLYDAVRDTVADLGLPLVRIQQERRRLEDIFREPEAGAVSGGVQ
jgi:ABC-2 type transport system ATP-binding protein